MQDFGLNLFRYRAVVERAGVELVRAGEDILSHLVHIVCQVVACLHPEQVVEASFDGSFHLLEALGEAAGLAIALLHFEGEAHGIVPQAVGLHLIAAALRHGLTVDVGVHPAQGHTRFLGPKQAVLTQLHLRAALQIAFDHLLEELAVLLPGAGLVAGIVCQVLHGLGETQRRLHLVASVQVGILVFLDQISENLLEEFHVARVVERQAGQGDGRLAHTADLVPGETGADAGGRALVGEHLFSSGLQALIVVAARHPVLGFAGELGLEVAGDDRLGGGGEHDALPFLERHLEETGHQQVFLAIEATAVFFLVHDVLVPVRHVHVVARLGNLEVQTREVAVQAEGDTALFGGIMGVGITVGHGQRVDAAESQVGFEPQHRVGVSIQQGVADEQLSGADHKEDLFFEKHTAHPVGDHRIRIHFEIDNVFVPTGFIHVPVAMDAEIEGHPVLQQRLVEGGKQHIAVSAKLLDRYGQQAVVLAGVAAHDGGVAVAAGTVGCEKLPFEGIFEIHELRLVELQIGHSLTENLIAQRYVKILYILISS